MQPEHDPAIQQVQPQSARLPLSQTAMHRSPDGSFLNPWPDARPHGLRDALRWVRERNRRPDPPPSIFPHANPSFATPRAATGETTVTWIGHSTFLLQIGSLNILTDPIWSSRASPVTFAGPRRIIGPAVRFDSLPPVDLVLLSHDHYDHLDSATARLITSSHPSARWIVPLGVAQWLRRRGVPVAAELDWWQKTGIHGLDITCTPAQHFSGRRPDNRNSTLWCGWTVRATGNANSRTVFYSGDTGRHPEFGAITRLLGPFDAAFIPIGAYDPRWFMGPVHMAPEEAVSAYVDIAAANAGRRCTFVAMHWGTFKLTDEPMDEPPALTRTEWMGAGLDPTLLWIPEHGSTLHIAAP